MENKSLMSVDLALITNRSMFKRFWKHKILENITKVFGYEYVDDENQQDEEIQLVRMRTQPFMSRSIEIVRNVEPMMHMAMRMQEIRKNYTKRLKMQH